MRFQNLTIRARLLALALGLVVPLELVAFYSLWEFRQASINEVNESVASQANLAATAFEQRVEAQRKTLETIAILASGQNEIQTRAALTEYLNSIVETRPNWLDVQIVGADGAVRLAQSYKKMNLRAIPVENLRREIAGKKSFIIAAEQNEAENLRLLTLALPTADGGFVVARIDGASVSEVFQNLDLPPDNIIVVFDPDNRLVYRSRASTEQIKLEAIDAVFSRALDERSGEKSFEIESPFDGVRRIYGLAKIDSTNALVAVGVPSARLYEPARRRFYRQLFVSLLVAALAAFAAYRIALGIVRPLRNLTDAAQAFGAGDLQKRAVEGGGGSVRQLGETFNRMAEEIERREEELKTLDRLKSEFVSNVSHELRTPLTTIKTLTSVLRRNRISAEEREEFLATIAEECDRQIEFVQNLLDLSRLEAGAYQVALVKTNIVEVAREATDAHRKTAQTRGLNLQFNPPEKEPLFSMTDAGALKRIVSSLIENAIKYTPEAGEISVSVRAENEKFVVEIADAGGGIRAEDVPRIFEKFYRGRPLGAPNDEADAEDGETENETSGIGLGLYLVKNLAAQIGAEITVESPADAIKNQGTRFTIFLPSHLEPK